MITRLLVAALAAALLPIAAFAQTSGGQTGALIGGDGVYVFKALPLAAGAFVLGQGAANDPAPASMSGDCTINSSGAITCTKNNGTSFGTAANANTGTSGNTIPLNNTTNTFSGLQTFTGHVAAGSSSPALSACGTSPAIVGDDKDGQVTMGTGTPGGCTITFNAAYTAAPLCTVSWQTNLASMTYTVSTTAITTTQTSTSSDKLNYHCSAQNGG